MKSFLKALAIISVGTTVAVAIFVAPSSTPSLPEAFAQVSGGAGIVPVMDPLVYIRSLPSSHSPSTTPVPYAFPGTNLYVEHYIGNGPVQMDLNGDGLQDLIYSFYRVSAGNPSSTQYVLLNNGQGFEYVYTCHIDTNSSTGISTYYGDCAG